MSARKHKTTRKLLALAADGPVERTRFRVRAKVLYRDSGRKQPPWQALVDLAERGYLVCEYRLTEAGRKWLEEA